MCIPVNGFDYIQNFLQSMSINNPYAGMGRQETLVKKIYIMPLSLRSGPLRQVWFLFFLKDALPWLVRKTIVG